MSKQSGKRTKHAKEQALSRDGKLSFQHILESELDRVMYYALCEYGLRVSEFAHMRGEWLDREQGLISIPPSQQCNCRICMQNKEHPGVWEPKTIAGSRVLPAEKLSREGWDHLTSWFDRNKEIGLTRFQVYHRIRHFGKLIGMPKLHPHSLRATAAISMSTRPEVTTTVLTGLMGWEKLGTAEIYIDASKSDVLKAFGITLKGSAESQIVRVLPDRHPRKTYTRKKTLERKSEEPIIVQEVETEPQKPEESLESKHEIAVVAQPEEQRVCNSQIVGANPSGSLPSLLTSESTPIVVEPTLKVESPILTPTEDAFDRCPGCSSKIKKYADGKWICLECGESRL